MKRWDQQEGWCGRFPDEIWRLLLVVSFERFETHKTDYIRLNRMRQVSKNFSEIVTNLFYYAKSLPLTIENLITSEEIIQKHPKVESLVVGNYSRLIEAIPSLNVLKEFHYYIYDSRRIEHLYQIASTNLQNLTMTNYSGLEKPNLSILKANVYNITSLKLQFGDSLELECIKPFVNLTGLYVENAQNLTDSIIQSLTLLRNLTIGRARKLTNQAFSTSSNLVHLNIQHSDQITDDAITHLVRLESFTTNYRVTDQCLCHLTNIKKLHLTKKSGINIGLKDLPNLESLRFENILINSDLIPLASSLTSLDFSYSDTLLGDGALLKMTNLRSLKLQNHNLVRKVSTLTSKCLSTLTGLTSLSLEGNRLVQDHWLTGLTNLTELDFFGTRIKGSCLTKFQKLKTLTLPVNISDSTVKDITNLPNLTDVNARTYTEPRDFWKFLPVHVYVNWV